MLSGQGAVLIDKRQNTLKWNSRLKYNYNTNKSYNFQINNPLKIRVMTESLTFAFMKKKPHLFHSPPKKPLQINFGFVFLRIKT